MSATIQYPKPAEPEVAEPEVEEPEVYEDEEDDEVYDLEEVFEIFDPSDHTVVEVNAYLDHATASERVRVLTAERDGKNRKGVGL